MLHYLLQHDLAHDSAALKFALGFKFLQWSSLLSGENHCEKGSIANVVVPPLPALLLVQAPFRATT